MPQNPRPAASGRSGVTRAMRGRLLLIAGILAPTLAIAAPTTAPEKTVPDKGAPPAAAPAATACKPPEPPQASARPVKPALPEKPACLDAKGGCPGWEAYSFNDAVKAYNLQAQAFRPIAEAYVQKLNAYVKASGEYAQCEINAMQN